MLIQLKNIKKEYKIGDDKYLAIKGVTFEIEKGEMVAIMGPSGSGKSSLMNIIGILDNPTEGEYILNGVNIKNKSRNELADIRNKEIGFIFQSFNLLPRTTVYENVELPLIYRNNLTDTERNLKVEYSLKAVGLYEKRNNLSNAISGGQIQRVAIARAICGDPSILLADEPTGNLDTKTSIEIMNIFQKMNAEGRTIILITHEPDIAKYCKRVIHIRDGLLEKDEILN